MSAVLRLTIDEVPIELDRTAAGSLADELWRGLQPGAVTSAAKVSAALARLESGISADVSFAEYEVGAVRHALAAVGSNRG